MKSRGRGLALAVARDLGEHRAPATAEELADFETDVLAGFVLAQASAGLTDSTIRNDTNHLELIRDWFGRPLWEMQPADADTYVGEVVRDARPSTRTGRAAALTVSFRFLELLCAKQADTLMAEAGRTERRAHDFGKPPRATAVNSTPSSADGRSDHGRGRDTQSAVGSRALRIDRMERDRALAGVSRFSAHACACSF